MTPTIVKPIIKSLIDTDMYKFTMCQMVLELYPQTQVEYRFTNRGEQRFNQYFMDELKKQIYLLKYLELTQNEYNYLKENIPYFKPAYLEYLKNFRFKPEEQVSVKLTEDNNIDLKIKGLWHETILYETILMSIISELYFKIIDTKWDYKKQGSRAGEKIGKLSQNNCLFAEFGSRRRRSYNTQDMVIKKFCEYGESNKNSTFIGSSNVHFCHKYQKYNLKPIGTLAHEIFLAAQNLSGIRHSNRFVMENWTKVYGNYSLGIILPDTLTTDLFLKDFDRYHAVLFDGIRQDSGNPFEFTDKIVNRYKTLNINPLHKTIIYSDGLDIEKCLSIKKYCEGKIKCSFGIGTFLTNDFRSKNNTNVSPSLNMVIKLYSVNNTPIVKLSDSPGKEMGDPKAIEVTKWIINH